MSAERSAWTDARRAEAQAKPLRDLAAENERLREALERACFIAEHLFQMIDRQTWRDSGGDDGQGHYEGDFHATNTVEEIKRLAALAAVTEEREHD